MGVITNTSKILKTLKPDGTSFIDLTTLTDYTKNRIGEYKKIELGFSSTQDLSDTVIYFNPALATPNIVTPYSSGAIPAEGYMYLVDSASTMGTFDMVPFVTLPGSIDAIKNYEIKIEIGYGNDFVIHIKFYQDEDRLGFLVSSGHKNHDKLLKDKITSAAEITVSGDSVYTNSSYFPKFYICQVDIVDPTIKSFNTIFIDRYKAGFYSKNYHETAPYFTDPVWELSDINGVRTNLSILEDTKVRFYVNAPIAPDTSFTWFHWLIRTNTFDNSVDFLTNYEASFAHIIDDVGSTTFNNKLKGPALALAVYSGLTYTGYCHVDKSLLTIGAKYRFISVVYDADNIEVNSFISNEYEVGLPSFNGLGYSFVAKLRDYFNDYYGNNLTCVVEERMQSIININYDYFGFSDDILFRLGLVVPNDIRRYLTKVTIEIYEDASVQLRNYLQRSIAYKTGPTTYITPDGMELNFTTANLEIKYPWRNRYETSIPNVESTYNGIIIAPASNQNWATRTLKVRTKLELFYDDFSTPFVDELVFTQTIKPKDYAQQGLTIYAIVGGKDQAIASTDYFCPEDENCFNAVYSSGSYADYRLITTIERDPGTITTIEENEELTGVLTQSDTNKFINQEVSYGQTTALKAKFCIDGTKFIYDTFYKMSAMAKKLTK